MEENNNINPEENKNIHPLDRKEEIKPISEKADYSTEATQMFGSGLDLGFLNTKVNAARHEISKFVIGQKDMVDLLLISIFSNGHVLLEGVPGVAKTLTAKVLSSAFKVPQIMSSQRTSERT